MAVDFDVDMGRPGNGEDVRRRRTRNLTETGVYAFLFLAFAEVAIQLRDL